MISVFVSFSGKLFMICFALLIRITIVKKVSQKLTFFVSSNVIEVLECTLQEPHVYSKNRDHSENYPICID